MREVILAIDGTAIKDYGNIVDIVGKAQIGKTLKIEVWRNKAKLDLFVTVGVRP